MVVDALLSAFSVVTIAPLADLLLNKPESEWMGVTSKLSILLQSYGIDFNIISVAVIFWLTMLGMAVFSVLVRWKTVKLRVEVVRHLINTSMTKIFAAGWEYFSSVKRGDLINTYVNEVNKAGNAFQSISVGIAGIARILAFIIVPFWLEPKMVVIALVLAVLLMLPFMYLGKISYKLGKRNVNAANSYTSFLRESLDAAKEVIGFGCEQHTINKVDEKYLVVGESRVKSETFSYFSSQMYEPVGFLVLLSVLVLFMQSAQTNSLSSVAVVLWGLLRTVPPLKQLIHLKHGLDNNLPSLEQVIMQQNIADSYRRPKGVAQFDDERMDFDIIKLNFNYQDGTPALKNISLSAKKGETIALVGESGSGKSTLVDLFLGLHHPSSGEIRLNDINLSEIDIQRWRDKVAFVPQRPVLFDLSLKNNLLWAYENATEEELRWACEVADAQRFINQLPKGMDTEIGDSGIRLSGGQAQRIALARALVKKPELLILDEATSALDLETEARVFAGLFEKLNETLVILIAHRLSTLENVDCIYVFRHGKIIESGTFGMLEKNDGYFKQLLETQKWNAN